MNLSEIILEKIKTFHKGKDNAIKRKDLLIYCNCVTHYGVPVFLVGSLTDRQLRNIYTQLPVVTCDEGIFWPIRKEELDEFEAYCRKKALPLFIRVKMVMKEHEHLRVGMQKELF